MASDARSTKNAGKPKKRFVGRATASKTSKTSTSGPVNNIPYEIWNNIDLAFAIARLPPNYSFEIHKTIHQIRKNDAKMVALQMPEGLQMFACAIADIIEQFTSALTVIMADVTYGACCIDDYTAVALGCDMLIHYGHSCLVPIDTTTIKTLYIFVEIFIDSKHLARTIRLNFSDDKETFIEQCLSNESERRRIPAGTLIGVTRHLRIAGSSYDDNQEASITGIKVNSQPTHLALVSTIQFAAALQRLKEDLAVEYVQDDTTSDSGPKLWTGKYITTIPRSKPLSPGEILGCTAPTLNDVDALLYLGDGRFHLESIMIANPSIPAFRYDPYSKKLTRERYDHEEMNQVRTNAIQMAQSSLKIYLPSLKGQSDSDSNYDNLPSMSPSWGIILGTLGRQGSFKQLKAILRQMDQGDTKIPYAPILLSELSPAKLALFKSHISTFVQTACPRLSIDWGFAFDKPLLTPYEARIAMGKTPWWAASQAESIDIGNSNGKNTAGTYPMNFYEANTPWAISRSTGSFE